MLASFEFCWRPAKYNGRLALFANKPWPWNSTAVGTIAHYSHEHLLLIDTFSDKHDADIGLACLELSIVDLFFISPYSGVLAEGFSMQYDSFELVTETVRKYFPETWIWSLVPIKWVPWAHSFIFTKIGSVKWKHESQSVCPSLFAETIWKSSAMKLLSSIVRFDQRMDCKMMWSGPAVANVLCPIIHTANTLQ